ncbi:hypothetical protein DEA8626_00943 [Defluviimonas aquaemixtae]|uniref:Uncharacterized protein n=1 Tax=Albidovulum aquaemixtae TaxID=1542388 RepID=A0A2R8B4B0_9RHOB|nr:hypothetical protein [Defluviimonas aquaemixtae]SPH17425.1 hypothetical protein DEA8626_00943 [Defluviimonas aquaemixtae]
MPAIAALTGDLVGSTSSGADAVERAMEILDATAEEIGRWPRGTGAKFTRYRGDGWQVIVAPPDRALRAALLLSARLRAASDVPPTRIAIGLGAAESLGSDDLSDAHGTAFESSGRALEQMRRDTRLAIGGTDVTPLHRAIVDLLDERMSRWTPEQAEATALALDPAEPTQADMAARLGISSQAMSYRLSGAGTAAIRRALHGWETTGEGQPA